MRQGLYRRSRCHGAALVEFVITAPVLLMSMLMIGEFGRAFFEYNTLTKSVRQGARFLVDHTPSTVDAMVVTGKFSQQAQNMVLYGSPVESGDPLLSGMSRSNIAIDVIDSATVRVSASYRYTPAMVSSLPGFWYGKDTPLNFTMRASTTMRSL